MTTRHDHAHHHPVIRKVADRWAWSCTCGGRSTLCLRTRVDWHATVVGALVHSAVSS